MTPEEKSIRFVIKYEKKCGRKPKDVHDKFIGYDIRSTRRYIEVKSRNGRTIPPFITLTDTIIRRLGKGIAKYYIYIVYDLKKEPKLIIIPPDKIFNNLKTGVFFNLGSKVYSKIEPIRLAIRT